MDRKISRRLNALNHSIDSKLDRIEGRIADATENKAPRMLQKQAMRQKSEITPVASSKPEVSLAAPSIRPIFSNTIVWSRQGIEQGIEQGNEQGLDTPSEPIRTCYRLKEGGRTYEENSTLAFQEMMADERLTDDSTVVVQMGDLKTATGEDLIQTSGMSDCSSIVLLTDFNAETRTYGKRSLIHIPGSSFECLDNPNDLADELCRLAKASSEKPLMILATGRISTANITQKMIIPAEIRSEDGNVRQPLMELMALCEVNILPLTSEITVWPDGSLLTRHDYTMLDSWSRP